LRQKRGKAKVPLLSRIYLEQMRDQPSPETLAFVAEANTSIAAAQAASLAVGIPIVYKDAEGRYVEEYPGGRIFEICFHPGESGDRHVEIVRELAGSAR
jgi:hypothetical protein